MMSYYISTTNIISQWLNITNQWCNMTNQWRNITNQWRNMTNQWRNMTNQRRHMTNQRRHITDLSDYIWVLFSAVSLKNILNIRQRQNGCTELLFQSCTPICKTTHQEPSDCPERRWYLRKHSIRAPRRVLGLHHVEVGLRPASMAHHTRKDWQPFKKKTRSCGGENQPSSYRSNCSSFDVVEIQHGRSFRRRCCSNCGWNRGYRGRHHRSVHCGTAWHQNRIFWVPQW